MISYDCEIRRIRKPISVVLMLALMLSVLCFGYKPLTANSVEYFSFIVPGQTYYLKNVKSGKYLTVQHNVATEGQNIVQWHYTGFDGNVPNNNQKWRFVKKTISNVDYYQIVSVLDTSYAISLANSSLGTQAKLATVNSNDNKQLFSAYLLTNDAHRFFSKISNLNYALVVNGASVYVSISEIMNYDSILLTQAINMGDCVQIIRIEPNADKVLLTFCICNLNINSNPYLFSPVNCRLATHTKDDVYYFEYLRDICSDYQTYYNADYVRFIHVE